MSSRTQISHREGILKNKTTLRNLYILKKSKTEFSSHK